MKAIDAFEKLKASYSEIDSDDKKLAEFMYEMIMLFSEDMKELLISRHCKCNSASLAVLKEVNQKANKTNEMLFKVYGVKYLVDDFFDKFWQNKIGEYK